MAKAEVFTVDGQSTLTQLESVTASATANGDVSLREGGAAGAIKIVVRCLANSSATLSFDTPVISETGAWYVDVGTFTGGSITLVGN